MEAKTKKRSNSIITSKVDGDVLTFDVQGMGTLAIDAGKLSGEVRDAALMHGLRQRIQDAAAMSRNPETFQPASPEEKFKAMQSLVEHYNSGTTEWNRARAEGGVRETGGMLLEALVQLAPGKSKDDIRKYLDGLTKKEKDALSVSSRVRPIIESIRASRSKSTGIDGDELLKGIL